MPKLTVQNAEIKTAAVEIKTLTVAGRQVTQAVFKQLHERPLIGDDATLSGVPWGVVNYHPDKCDDRTDGEPHAHVVWQRGTDLFRSRVDMDVTWPRWITVRSGRAWLDAKVRDAVLRDRCPKDPPESFTRVFLGIAVRMEPSAEAEALLTQRQLIDLWREDLRKNGPSHPVRAAGRSKESAGTSGLAAAREAAAFSVRKIPVSDALAEVERDFEVALAAFPAVSLADAEALLLAEVRAEADLRSRHHEVLQAIADLPQLFIAV